MSFLQSSFIYHPAGQLVIDMLHTAALALIFIRKAKSQRKCPCVNLVRQLQRCPEQQILARLCFGGHVFWSVSSAKSSLQWFATTCLLCTVPGPNHAITITVRNGCVPQRYGSNSFNKFAHSISSRRDQILQQGLEHGGVAEASPQQLRRVLRHVHHRGALCILRTGTDIGNQVTPQRVHPAQAFTNSAGRECVNRV